MKRPFLSTEFDRLLRLAANNPYWVDFYRVFNIGYVVSETSNVRGAVVEAGTGLGFSLAALILACEQQQLRREIFTFDSFEGLPAPSPEDFLGSRALAEEGALRYDAEVVLGALDLLGLSEDLRSRVNLVEGFFEQSFPRYRDLETAVLHIDCDLYDSTRLTLETFWPRMPTGSMVILDEYHQSEEWSGERLAVDEFLAKVKGSAVLESDPFGIRFNIRKV